MDERWLQTISHMTYGIYVLTSAKGEELNGMIASWVSQISYQPPLVMVAVHPNRYSHRLVEGSGVFALHVLGRHQKDLIRRFKGPDPAGKFASLHWFRGRTGCPILQDCLGCIECEIREKYQPGNHTLFVGEIVEVHTFLQGDPLSTLDYEGFYLGKA